MEVLRLLEGVIDIYLPDAKYADNVIASQLSGFVDYVEHNRAALREMYRQVGPGLDVNDDGIARRGLIVRHLVLPHRLAGTQERAHLAGEQAVPRIYVSLMAQYFPAYDAVGHPLLGRRPTAEEYDEAFAVLDEIGFEDGWARVGGRAVRVTSWSIRATMDCDRAAA